MNYPSNPNPDFTYFDETFKFDDYEYDAFQMIMDEISLEDHSPTLSWTSSEKLLATEVTSPLQTSLATSTMMSPEIVVDKNEIKKRKRHKDDQTIIHVFKTKSIEEILDDGYKWRKYGKKWTRGSQFQRHYHKCSNPDCIVKKKIERDTNNPEYVLTTYEGRHNHPSPSVVYCDSDDFDLTSLNTWSFQTHTYNYSHSAP